MPNRTVLYWGPISVCGGPSLSQWNMGKMQLMSVVAHGSTHLWQSLVRLENARLEGTLEHPGISMYVPFPSEGG